MNTNTPTLSGKTGRMLPPGPPAVRVNLPAGAALLASAAAALLLVQPSAVTATPAAAVPGPGPTAPQREEAQSFAPPIGATAELFISWTGDDSLREVLERAGVAAQDSESAETLVADALPGGIAQGTQIAILVGESIANKGRRLERLSFDPTPALKITVGRSSNGELKLARDGLAADAKPRRFSGKAGSDIFWSMRSAGVPAEAAREFVEALSRRLDVRAIAYEDTFELVIDHFRDPGGKARSGPLLYAVLRRTSGKELSLVRWTVAGQSGLFDPNTPIQQAAGLAKPVQGSVSSRFGRRNHPILRFVRFHSGVDFRAERGTPVIAAADGVVWSAGWAGGYGRQVQISHTNGVSTSYSHLSAIAAAPGERVKRGDVIGLAGSSGLSTGPHLHFEVRKDGRAVDPLAFSMAPPSLSRSDLVALRARADQLRGV